MSPLAHRPSTATPVAKLRELYEGDAPGAHRFRYALLVFDVATAAFVVATSFLPLHRGSSPATWR